MKGKWNSCAPSKDREREKEGENDNVVSYQDSALDPQNSLYILGQATAVFIKSGCRHLNPRPSHLAMILSHVPERVPWICDGIFIWLLYTGKDT